MKTWFEVKVKFNKLDSNGEEKATTESYLFDSVTWTESEARTLKELSQVISGEFSIESIKKTKYAEVFAYNSGEYWFKVVSDIISIDDTGKEMKNKINSLIMADDLECALARFKEKMNDCCVPFAIASISISNILDVFPYV